MFRSSRISSSIEIAFAASTSAIYAHRSDAKSPGTDADTSRQYRLKTTEKGRSLKWKRPET